MHSCISICRPASTSNSRPRQPGLRNTRSMMLRVFFYCLALIAATGTAFADDAPQPRFAIASVQGANFKILGGLFVKSGSTDYVCVAYQNLATAPMTLARFKLFFVTPKHEDTTVEVKTTGAPNARVMPPMKDTAGDPATMPNCVVSPADRSQAQAVFIFPDHFDFADGTSWDLKKKGTSPSPSPSPSATP